MTVGGMGFIPERLLMMMMMITRMKNKAIYSFWASKLGKECFVLLYIFSV